jgi:hypothetical protein
MENLNTNYFERVYLGKKNDRVSTTVNKRLQNLITVKNNIPAKNDLATFRPMKSKSSQVNLELLLEKW